MAAWIVALFFLGFGAFIGLMFWWRRVRIRRGLEMLESCLAECSRDGAMSLQGTLPSGVAVRCTLDDDGDEDPKRTFLDAFLPPGNVTLDLRPSSIGGALMVHAGMAVDMSIGDPAFDKRFVIEGAPSMVVRKLLDEPVRRRIEALKLEKLSLEQGHLKIVRKGWPKRQEQCRSYFALIDGIASALPAALREVGGVEIEHASEAGDPYRSRPFVRDRRGEAAAELRALKAARWRRRRVVATMILIVFIAAIVGFIFGD